MSGATPVVVHLMRHGEPALAGRMLGRADAEVTPAGITACLDQAADLNPTAIVASDLARAARCADAIGKRRGTPVALDPRWRELDFGAWDGLAAADIPADPLAAFWRDPDAHQPPGGECWSALVERVAAALADLGDTTLVVAHAGSIRAALAVLCGFSPRQAWAVRLDYAALVTLHLWRGADAGAQIVRVRP